MEDTLLRGDPIYICFYLDKFSLSKLYDYDFRLGLGMVRVGVVGYGHLGQYLVENILNHAGTYLILR